MIKAGAAVAYVRSNGFDRMSPDNQENDICYDGIYQGSRRSNMAVENRTEYAAQTQAVQKDYTEGNQKTAGTKHSTAARKYQAARSMEDASQENTAEEGVRYDISQRKNDVAVWYQEYAKEEQEAQLGLYDLDEEQKKADKEKDDPLQEARDKAEALVKSLQEMLERMREQQKNQKKNQQKTKSKLSYSYRKVSNSISSAKTSMQASNALSSATANLSSIRRKAVSGKYEDREIEIALQHAEKMVRIARKKVANLKSEAMKQRRNASKESQKKQKNSTVHHVPQRQKAEKELQQLKAELRSREKQEKNGNRRDEDLDLMQADMEYLKRKIDLLKNHGLTLSSQNQQTIDDMAAAAMGVVSVGLKETAVNASEEGQTEAAASVETASVQEGGFETTV
jgi:hypothetical protein